MPKRKKYPKLPNGYGSIKYLGKGRRNSYAVHPPTTEFTENGVPKTPKALCYVDCWEKGFAVLTAYKNGYYYKGYENTIDIFKNDNRGVYGLSEAILSEYNRSKGIEKDKTFSEIYDLYYADKFEKPHSKEYSKQLRSAIHTSYKKCEPLYKKEFKRIRHEDLQDFIDGLTCGYATQENVIFLFNQLYNFAIAHDYCEKKCCIGLKKSVEDTEEHGVPFSDQDLSVLWENKENEIAEFLLIMCYSGYRLSAYEKMEVNLDELYFQGGVKTKLSKNRIVPIHSLIVDLVSKRMERDGGLLVIRGDQFRANMYEFLESVGIEKHTPHDCRHTFSRLCESYGVNENDRKRMLGHKIGDITNDVYGHRTVEELRKEIEKIKFQPVTNED